MKKFGIKSKFVAILFGLITLYGCNLGGGTSSNTQYDSVPPPSVTQIVPPANFIHDGNTSVYIDTSTAQIAVPSISGYQIVSIPQSLADEIAANPSAAKTYLQHNILFQTTTNNVYWIDVSSASNKNATNLPKSASDNILGDSEIGDSQSYQYAIGTTTVINLNGKPITYSVLTNNKGTINYNTTANPNGSFAISDSDPQGVCPVANQKITAVQTALFNNIAFLAVGTANGTVCIDNLDQTTGLPISGNWQNLSERANKKVGPGAYIPNPVTSFGFYSSNNNLLAYWSLTAPDTGIISTYRVTGTFNGTDGSVPSSYLPQGFINLGISQPQALLNGIPSVQINFIPAQMSTNPAISMVNQDGYLCTVIGSGYKNSKLEVYTFTPYGNTNWSNVQQFLSGDSEGFGTVTVQYGIDDQCVLATSIGKTYSIIPKTN